MDILKEAALLKKDKSPISFDDAFKDKKIVALYFSAHWCPPCKRFTPILRDAYEDMIDAKEEIEIVFVSSDRTADDQFHYMDTLHGDWLTITLDDDAVQKLSTKFSISGIPSLVVLKNDDAGTVVTTNGRGDIDSKGPGAFKIWNN